MGISEFDLIREFCQGATRVRADVLLGIGDDAALLRCSPGRELVMTLDTLVAGRHFLPDADPQSLGHKALAVNLSDLAAMGAEPAWALLSLTLPRADSAWLAGFMAGFSRLADAHEVQLVGGDTCSGPLAISVQLTGFVEPGTALLRSGASVGDLVYLSGAVGDAALALQLHGRGEPIAAQQQRRLDRPEPRLQLGRRLRGLASAAIDVSDGLLADLGHLCSASGVAAEIDCAALPLSPATAAWIGRDGDWSLALAGGDDYELCFTLPPSRGEALERELRGLDVAVHCIGRIGAGQGVSAILPDGSRYTGVQTGWDHFR